MHRLLDHVMSKNKILKKITRAQKGNVKSFAEKRWSHGRELELEIAHIAH